MKVYIVWRETFNYNNEFTEAFETEESAKKFVEERTTFGNTVVLFYEEYDVIG